MKIRKDIEMENSSEYKASSKLSDAIKGICGYTLKADYDMTLELYKSEGEALPECSHSFTGSSKRNVVKTVAFIAAASIVVCIVSSLCSFFSSLFKN